MKKNIIIGILAIAFVASFSWNWIGKANANANVRGDHVEETAQAMNTFVGNGGTFSGASGGGGRLQMFFAGPVNQQVTSLSVTIINIDDEDIEYIIDP